MGNKALGRDLGDLLSRARPARIVRQVTPPGATPVESPPDGAPAASLPVPSPAAIPSDHLAAASSPEAPLEGSGTLVPGSGSESEPSGAPVRPVLGSRVRSPLFYVLVGVDLVLVAGAVGLGVAGWLAHPAALAGAVAAVALGGAASAFAVVLPKVEDGGTPSPESRVRVHLTRV